MIVDWERPREVVYKENKVEEALLRLDLGIITDRITERVISGYLEKNKDFTGLGFLIKCMKNSW